MAIEIVFDEILGARYAKLEGAQVDAMESQNGDAPWPPPPPVDRYEPPPPNPPPPQPIEHEMIYPDWYGPPPPPPDHWAYCLPPCPPVNPDIAAELTNTNPRKDGWGREGPNPFHAGAICFRSYGDKKCGRSGQQCCYDKDGNLITGHGAGTPDKVGPGKGPEDGVPPGEGEDENGGIIDDPDNVWDHIFEDVIPAILQSESEYHEGWPPRGVR
jgi:hypothetical protein